MILVDTSIWIDHFRAADPQLADLLTRNEVLTHPAVIGEIALGSVAARAEVLRHLKNLPAALVATAEEVMVFIDNHGLANSGVGYVDASLLASAALTPGAALWARDKKLHAAAVRCGVAAKVSS
ncbi:MAG: VapC toxin family PIN domain ribonuclease [Alphaproteobacteria bacterium]|nr:MAG: VapC toxin family PIN domain ribonuclease [Alphaproteobacteria bacterium]